MTAPCRQGTGRHGLVASESRDSAQAGLRLLESGGNAVDAAVAAAIAETVVAPHNAGLLGFASSMLIYRASDRRTISIKADTVAPRRSTPGMFVGRRSEHRAGPLSVGIPGVLRGLECAVLQFGRSRWRDVVAPGMELASAGFTVSASTSGVMQRYRKELRGFPSAAAMLMPGGHVPRPRSQLRFPDLAASLSRIADEGADAFYRGDLGRQVVQHLRAGGGLLDESDLASYAPDIGSPVVAEIGGRQFATTALPGGGVTTLQLLRILDALPKPVAATPMEDPVYVHHLVQAMKLVWRDRLVHLADPAFMGEPPERFLDRAHTDAQAQRVLSGAVAEDFVVPADFSCTSHVSAADADGNLATVTFTHGFAYGSMVVAPGTGLILGHGMARFDGAPGKPNSVAPGKKALHNMAPLVIHAGDGRVVALGWTGGRRIPNVVAQVAENLVRFGMALEDALAAPNLHSEGAEPTTAERDYPASAVAALEQRGHRVMRLTGPIGFGSAIVLDVATREATGATDPRRVGHVAVAGNAVQPA